MIHGQATPLSEAVSEADVLNALGFAEGEHRVYRHLITHPGARRRDIARALDLSERHVQRLLDAIAATGVNQQSQEQPLRDHPAPGRPIEPRPREQQVEHRAGEESTLQNSPLLDAMRELFEALWQQATMTEPGRCMHAPQSPESMGRLPPKLRPILVLLAAGMNDKAIAHELCISPRTLERRMATLLRLLGARTRFHAGYLAARLLD